jgi:Yip1-like protein
MSDDVILSGAKDLGDRDPSPSPRLRMTGSPSLRDLVTILYRPRETMRRILDSGADRWAVQIIVLAYFCSQMNDPDLRNVNEVLPWMTSTSIVAIVLLGMIFMAAVFVLLLFAVSWPVTFVGRLLGGTGPNADVRAAIAWGWVPMIWSVFVRIPMAIYAARLHLPGHVQGREAILNLLAQGGCALGVVIITLQIVLFGAWLYVTSLTVAEAQRFSSAKGFANVAIALAGPFIIGAAAVIAFRH